MNPLYNNSQLTAHSSQLTAHSSHDLFCNSSSLIPIDKKNNIYHCTECGLYIASQSAFHSPDNPKTEEEMMTSLEVLRRENYSKILQHIQQHFGSRELYGLDVGCARGWFLDEAEKLNIKMDGIEPEENFFLEASRYGVNVVHGLFPQDFRLAGKYDFIIFNDVFEHLSDIDTVMEKCISLLKSGGIIIINCPDSGGIFFRVAKIMRVLGIESYWRRLWQMDFYSPHLWYFNHNSLNILMQHYGFSCTESFALKTITLKGLRQRIMCDSKNAFAGYITFFMVSASSPFLALLPKDIMCAFFVKS